MTESITERGEEERLISAQSLVYLRSLFPTNQLGWKEKRCLDLETMSVLRIQTDGTCPDLLEELLLFVLLR